MSESYPTGESSRMSTADGSSAASTFSGSMFSAMSVSSASQAGVGSSIGGYNSAVYISGMQGKQKNGF